MPHTPFAHISECDSFFAWSRRQECEVAVVIVYVGDMRELTGLSGDDVDVLIGHLLHGLGRLGVELILSLLVLSPPPK